MLSLTLPEPTWLHRVPAGAKLLALAAATMLVLPVERPAAALAVLAAVLLLHGAVGRAALKRLGAVRPLLPILLVVVVAQAVIASPAAGIAVAARILSMVLLANLVTMTTRMDDMLRAVSVLFVPLRLVGVSPTTPALAVALVVRFVPVLLAEWRALGETFRARTGRRPGIGLIAPFALRMLDLSDHVGEALAARYAPSERRRGGPAEGSD